jgi:predicted ATP-grasp superfamily ATP-dependent carboligase
MPKMTHAVVVRGELNGLGVIRSLARGSVPTILVDTTRLHAGTWSRFCQVRIVKQFHGPPLIRALLALQRELGERPPLILTDEMAVLTVSKHRDLLDKVYRIQLPSPDIVTKLSDKARFQEFAESHGLPVPRAATIKSEADLLKLNELRFPVIIKPADKRPVYLGETDRLHICSDRLQCSALCRQLVSTAGEFVAQEWIEGPDQDIFFTLFHQGRDPDALTIFSGRKIVCNPPGVGSTAFCTAAPDVSAELEALTRSYIALSSYEGLGSVEFKFDAMARRFVIIEPTVGRTDWQEEIATLSGVNIPLAAYRHAMGLPPLRSHAGSSVAWQESVLRWKGRTRLSAPAKVYDGYWRLRDPMPAVVHYGHAVAKQLRRVVSARPVRQVESRTSANAPAPMKVN